MFIEPTSSFLQIYRRLLSPFTVHAEICHYKNIVKTQLSEVCLLRNIATVQTGYSRNFKITAFHSKAKQPVGLRDTF